MDSLRWPITAMIASVFVVVSAALGNEDSVPVRVLIPPDCIVPEQGHCFLALMDFGEPGDKLSRNGSMLQLWEDGKPLGPPHAAHADIRRSGRGRYSHWNRATLYFSASDNSDPRHNGRRYEVSSAHPNSTLGGLDRFPSVEKRHREVIGASRHEYRVGVGGTLDWDNTRTLTTNNCYIAFRNNISLTIENTGDRPVVNPRLVLNNRGNWFTFESLLEEFTRGATTDQEKAYFIWENMRQNLYHESPLFGNSEPHDPVRLLNIFGFNLCDDAGNAGCSLFHHAGLTGSKNRALNGHVQCEALVDGEFQFLDIDMDCFYLDRENERPVSGDECARDHDLVRRELNYGPVVDQFVPSDRPAALFGPDDRRYDAYLRGHEIAYTLRPGEKVVFRWDNQGKYCAENESRAHRPKFFGNSQFVYQPRLTPSALRDDADSVQDVVAASDDRHGSRLAATSDRGAITYRIAVPYSICGGKVAARFFGAAVGDEFGIEFSLDGKQWQRIWRAEGRGPHDARVALDDSLRLYQAPAKYTYFIRLRLKSTEAESASLCSLHIETDVLCAPVSLPRLRCGTNAARYWDATKEPHEVTITHVWRESDAVQPPPAPAQPIAPRDQSTIRQSIVSLKWPKMEEADAYHLRVSRRPDFKYPYRPSLDVIIPHSEWSVPVKGIFSPDTTYYWRVRCRNRWGVWGSWSPTWTFRWEGPRIPVKVRMQQRGRTAWIAWEPNPRGTRPVKYHVYGSDEQGFSVHRGRVDLPGRGTVDGNFFAETTRTSIQVVSDELKAANANRVFYRVVAVDEHGTESGCSDYVELPHPWIYSDPPGRAVVGKPFRYQIKSLRSLGDYQCRRDPDVTEKRYAYRYWDVEQQSFHKREGPKWLTVDSETGIMQGTPSSSDVGVHRVRVELTDQFGRRDTQEFDLSVVRPRGN